MISSISIMPSSTTEFFRDLPRRRECLGLIAKMLIKKLYPLPPLDEQRRIVDILNHAASIRRLREQAQAKAREIIPALFLDMFGDPATNPKGWKRRTLGELGELDRGKSKHRPRNAPELFGGEYPFIQTGDVANSGGIITVYSQTYSETGWRRVEYGTLGRFASQLPRISL